MIKIYFENDKTELSNAKNDSKFIAKTEIPDFVKFTTNITKILSLVKKYKSYSNIIIIGNGGAINPFRSFYTSLSKTNKKVYFLNTVDPDYIIELKKLDTKDTLIVMISKSGTNLTAIESFFAFWKYKKIIITTMNDNPLYKIVEKNNLDFLAYPSIEDFPKLDDRHTGISAAGLTPTALLGIDIKEIYAGAKTMQTKCGLKIGFHKNPALHLATTLFELEKKGYNEIFCPVYSTKLIGFLPFIIQQMHETVCKDGKGQTIFGDLAPESQHHTNQRIFGGKRNVIILFITVKKRDNVLSVKVPTKVSNFNIKKGKLQDLEGISYSSLLEYEFKGTFQHAIEENIPVIHLEIEKITPKTVGELLVFFQYVAWYSALLRGVNPIGQPAVERSKEIGSELTIKNKK